MLALKIASFRRSVVSATRLLEFWEKQIALHGEAKATAFYFHLGLNHLETKSTYEYEGLTLSREPKEHEKPCVKGIAQAQESAKEKIAKVLLTLRSELISDGLDGIKKLAPAKYHELTLTAPPDIRESLRDRLIEAYGKARELVARELGGQKGVKQLEGDEFDDLDLLVDLTDARAVNEIQARIVAAASRNRLLGLSGAALWKAVEKEVAESSIIWLDRAATGAANKTIGLGRDDEMSDRAEDIDRYEYSALLDSNTCGPCFEDDGKGSTSPDDLPDTPNPDCAGSDFCRCFTIAISA